jgi:hypothetical protein
MNEDKLWLHYKFKENKAFCLQANIPLCLYSYAQSFMTPKLTENEQRKQGCTEVFHKKSTWIDWAKSSCETILNAFY